MNSTEMLEIIEKADEYLKDYGNQIKKNGKKFNWFDMSHLLGYLLPLTKEQILDIHLRTTKEE